MTELEEFITACEMEAERMLESDAMKRAKERGEQQKITLFYRLANTRVIAADLAQQFRDHKNLNIK